MHNGRVLVDNSRFAVMMALVIDSILFAGLLGAYMVLRAGAGNWPPPELSHFSLGFPLASEVSLGLAIIALGFSIYAQSANKLGALRFGLLASMLSLMIFLGLNGSDWITVMTAERVTHTLFGGIYFMITGIFHMHVMVGLFYAGVKLRQALRWKHYTRSTLSIQHLLYFYTLLAGMWMAIFFIVYP